ncbi:DUF1800 family protein [Rhizobium sp. LCM 4573]|uniref:DUF1800 domain-containing protein n=1 Tax=Rhizobium sp. LCM 4573 TaxID=1848291 RepID=UPI0008DAA4FE|nr:DUF1800 domain-containing protein [Rhizobium sp. LCM 4573]OHV76673.1 hypothetical protein LCM4573_13825 [Rhizobium sp. LCM 4573]
MGLIVPTMAAIRYGYGLRAGEDPVAGPDDLMKQVRQGLAEKPRFPREGLTGRRETIGKILSVRAAEAKAAQGGKPNPELRRETEREAQQIYQRDAMARIAQTVDSPNGFYERLVAFWAGHFATSAAKSFLMRMVVPLHEVEAIRPNVGGSFRDLLGAAILHPAMLIYLDQNRSVGPESPVGQKTERGLNENLGRELLELHTLGADGGYGQGDVRAAALILTGLTVDTRTLEVTYRRRLAEPGAITLLGKTYGEEGQPENDHLAMLDDLAANPQTARHICRKLVAHFIADDPPAEVIEAMVAAWGASNGDLMAVYRAMLDHPRAWTEEGRKVKQPFEFIVSGFRALGVPDKDFSELLREAEAEEDEEEEGAMAAQADEGEGRRGRSLARVLTIGALRRMGQPVWQPPSPAGFPDDAATWVSPSQVSERIAWARMAAETLGRTAQPADLLRAALADAAREDTIRLVEQAPSRAHGLTMVFASPEFNRR